MQRRGAVPDQSAQDRTNEIGGQTLELTETMITELKKTNWNGYRENDISGTK